MKLKSTIAAACALALTGCASTWYNPNLDGPALQRQFAIDDGRCIAVSSGSVPMPPVRVYQSGNTGPYYFSGTASSYDSYGGRSNSTYQGSVYSYPNAADSFATGFANGANIGAAMAASNNRQRVYNGCMMQLGWTRDKPAVSGPPVVPYDTPPPVVTRFNMSPGNDLHMDVNPMDFQRDKRKAAGFYSPPPVVPASPPPAPPAPTVPPQEEPVQEAINGIPVLAYWQKNDPKRWNLAVSVDSMLRESPEYQDVGLRDRLLIVVEKVRSISE